MNTHLGDAPLIDPTAKVRDARLGRYTEIGPRTHFAQSELGDYSYVMGDSDVIYTKIGKLCSIAAHTRLNPGNHPMQRATQSHLTYRASAYFDGEADEAAFFDGRKALPVTVGHDVWIGHGAIVLPGRTIGNGAVVAAAAVVTRNVPPYAIVAGNPAQVIRHRFSADIIEKLQEIAVWDWTHERLHAALADFRSLAIEAFTEKYQG